MGGGATIGFVGFIGDIGFALSYISYISYISYQTRKKKANGQWLIANSPKEKSQRLTALK